MVHLFSRVLFHNLGYAKPSPPLLACTLWCALMMQMDDILRQLCRPRRNNSLFGNFVDLDAATHPSASLSASTQQLSSIHGQHPRRSVRPSVLSSAATLCHAWLLKFSATSFSRFLMKPTPLTACVSYASTGNMMATCGISWC